jgi:hypothetical protein
MIYEPRVYQPVPGQMRKILARFRDKLNFSGVRSNGAGQTSYARRAYRGSRKDVVLAFMSGVRSGSADCLHSTIL